MTSALSSYGMKAPSQAHPPALQALASAREDKGFQNRHLTELVRKRLKLCRETLATVVWDKSAISGCVTPWLL